MENEESPYQVDIAMCRLARIMEHNGYELARLGQSVAASEKFIQAASICGPCIRGTELLQCREKTVDHR